MKTKRNHKKKNNSKTQKTYYANTVLEKMEKVRTINKEHPDYNKLYQDIISVGEFTIEKNT